MKHSLYISLFSLLSMMITSSLYYCIIFGIVSNKLIHWSCIDYFLDVTLSPVILSLVALLGISIGYRAGKKWWKIIYIDGVYYFDQSLKVTNTSQKPSIRRVHRESKPSKSKE